MIQACVSFFNDGAENLERMFKSIINKVDCVVAVDGAYCDWPLRDGEKHYSTDGCHEVALQYADKVIEADPHCDQVGKRNRYFNLDCEQDYYFIIDADEELFGHIPDGLGMDVYSIPFENRTVHYGNLKRDYIRIIRHQKGIECRGDHSEIWAGNRHIVARKMQRAGIYYEMLTGCHIVNHADKRPMWRNCQKDEYVANRGENENRKTILGKK